MPITAAHVDSLKKCSTCDEGSVVEPADVTVQYGYPDGKHGSDTVALCNHHADCDFWNRAKKTLVTQPAEALAAWDAATPTELQAAIDALLPAGHTPGIAR